MILSAEDYKKPPTPIKLKFKKGQTAQLSNFTLLSLIGKGKFSKVYLVKKNDNQKVYAMKVMKKRLIWENQIVENIINERNILVESNFPFIIQLHYSFQTQEKLYFVLDYCGGGELYGYLEKKGRFTEDEIRFYSSQVVLSLDYIHRQGIIYKDLKPENIIIFQDGYLKLTDFGLASHISQEQSGMFALINFYDLTVIIVVERLITWRLKLLKERVIASKSIGGHLVCFYLSYLRDVPPFLSTAVTSYSKKPSYPPQMSPELKALIQELLRKDPKERLGANGAEQIKSHQFFAGFNWNDLLHKRLTPPFIPELEHKADVKYISEQFVNAKIYSDDNSSMNSRQLNLEGFSYANGGLSPRSQFSDDKNSLSITNQIIEKCRKFNNSHAQLKTLANSKPECETQSKSQLNSPKQNELDSEFFIEEMPFVRIIPSQEQKKSLFANL